MKIPQSRNFDLLMSLGVQKSLVRRGIYQLQLIALFGRPKKLDDLPGVDTVKNYRDIS